MQPAMAAGFAERLRRRLRRGVSEQIARQMHRVRGAEEGEVYLHSRRVYILPTQSGFGFTMMLGILLVGAINYNLSLGFALTFLLGTIAVLDMYLTFRNLAFLYLAPGRAQEVFCGEQAQFELQLMNRRRYHRYAIWLGFMPGDPALQMPPEQPVDIAPHGAQTVTLTIRAHRRGWLAAPRIRLLTRFPLGLMRAWSYWQPAARVLVYPQPEDDPPPLPFSTSMHGDGEGAAGSEDFAGIRPYAVGDPLRQLAWRQIARMESAGTGQLVTKHFEGGAANRLCLDYAALPHALALETKLSRMTRWVIDAETLGLAYEFRLGQTHFASDLGTAHRQACLRALALFEG